MSSGNILLWTGDAFLLLSYWLLGRKRFRIGWLLSALASLGFVLGGIKLHVTPLWMVNVVFVIVALWNLWKEIYGKQ
jgi:uncharacterized membrane protein YfcA